MSAQYTFWSKAMTVKLSNGNGSETVVRLSMQSVIALSTVLIIAVISGLFIWVNALQSTVAAHGSDIAVLKQVDTSHRDLLTALDCKMDKIAVKLDEIREDQVKRQRQERSR